MDKLYLKCKTLGILQYLNKNNLACEVAIINKNKAYIFFNGEQSDLFITKIEDIPCSINGKTVIKKEITFEPKQIEFGKEDYKLIVSFILDNNKFKVIDYHVIRGIIQC